MNKYIKKMSFRNNHKISSLTNHSWIQLSPIWIYELKIEEIKKENASIKVSDAEQTVSNCSFRPLSLLFRINYYQSLPSFRSHFHSGRPCKEILIKASEWKKWEIQFYFQKPNSFVVMWWKNCFERMKSITKLFPAYMKKAEKTFNFEYKNKNEISRLMNTLSSKLN